MDLRLLSNSCTDDTRLGIAPLLSEIKDAVIERDVLGLETVDLAVLVTPLLGGLRLFTRFVDKLPAGAQVGLSSLIDVLPISCHGFKGIPLLKIILIKGRIIFKLQRRVQGLLRGVGVALGAAGFLPS